MNINKKYLIFIGLIFLSLGATVLGEARLENPNKSGGSLTTMIKSMINGVLQLAMPFLVLAIIYVGFLFAKAQGEPKALEEAKRALIWVVVGAAIIIGANTIYSVVYDTVSQISINKNINIEKIIQYV